MSRTAEPYAACNNTDSWIENVMNIRCRPMEIDDFGAVECRHWHSIEQVRKFIEKQGIASMLAFNAGRYAGQLYLQEYDPQFKNPEGWR